LPEINDLHETGVNAIYLVPPLYGGTLSYLKYCVFMLVV